MICNNCNNRISNDSVVCPHCAVPTGIGMNTDKASICPFCGTVLNSGDLFCATCGKRKETPVKVESRPITPLKEDTHKKNGNGALIALIIVLSVVIIGMAAYILVPKFMPKIWNVAFGGDENPQGEVVNTIVLNIDEYEGEVSSDYYTIYGTASADLMNCELTVNGETITTIVAGEGLVGWSKNLHLNEGLNTFTVELFDSNGTSKTETVNIFRSEDEDAFLFESDRYYITEFDLRGKTQLEVALIRNEIYARHGYIFSTPEYAEYFSQKSWYVPDTNFNESMLNDIEKANKDFLVQYEIDRGWR